MLISNLKISVEIYQKKVDSNLVYLNRSLFQFFINQNHAKTITANIFGSSTHFPFLVQCMKRRGGELIFRDFSICISNSLAE